MFSFHTFTIARLTSDDGSAAKEWVPTGKIVSGHLGTSSAEFAAMNDGEYGKTFQLFSDDLMADIKTSDRLTERATGEIYNVKGIVKNTDGPGRKIEVTLILHAEQ